MNVGSFATCRAPPLTFHHLFPLLSLLRFTLRTAHTPRSFLPPSQAISCHAAHTMAQILELPVELVEGILDHVEDPNDLTSLARVNHTLHTLADKRIWNRADKEYRYRILMWACATGNAPALRRLLNLGLTTNLHFQLGGNCSRGDDLTSGFFYLRFIDPSYVAIPYYDDFYEPAAPAIGRHTRQFWKPLHAAVYHGQGHIVDILLQHGVWVNEIATNYHGCDRPLHHIGQGDGKFTSLHVALCSGREQIAMNLISNGASIYTDRTVHRQAQARDPNRNRITALHLCAHHGLLSTAKYLVEKDYQTAVDELDEFGYSPMMYAYLAGEDSIVCYLLAQGASTRLYKPDYTPYGWDSFHRASHSLLHQACYDRRWEVVFKLAECGCDALEPDGNGDTPLDLCIKTCITDGIPEIMSVSEMNRDAQDMLKAIELCGMPSLANQDTLLQVARYALRGPVLSLLSYVLDRGLDISILLHSNNVYTKDGSDKYLGNKRDWPQAVNPQDYYHDTGLFPCEQTLLEFACCCIKSTPYLEETIDLLLSQGCIEPGHIADYVRVLKNLCCRYSSRDDDICEQSRLQCVRKICSHLAATIQSDISRPKLPVSLFFICLDRSPRVFLDELLIVFDFPDRDCSEKELWDFLLVLTGGFDSDTISRRISYLELVFKADKNNYLLQHKKTFTLLYTTLLKVKGGEKAVLDYLDRGGQYCLNDGRDRTPLFEACATNSLQLAERLIDMGAHPRNLISLDETYKPFYGYEGGPWERNLGNVAILRLLIERGADPFFARDIKYMSTKDRLYPFSLYIEGYNGISLEFFRALCELTINKKTDPVFLFNLLEFACTRGNLAGIQVLRSCTERRVDAIIRDKAAFFLQTLLAGLFHDDCYACSIHFTCSCIQQKYVREVDGAIDLIQLILEMGPASTLTSRWRLRRHRGKWPTALKLLEELLTLPGNPHSAGERQAPGRGHIRSDGLLYPCVALKDRYRYRLSWCLKERIRIDTIKGKPKVTIADGTIKLPSQRDDQEVRLNKTQSASLKEIPLPWGCSCEEEDEFTW
ncbi:hypothetical protein PG988_001312 [Apiospora saccharicola]